MNPPVFFFSRRICWDAMFFCFRLGAGMLTGWNHESYLGTMTTEDLTAIISHTHTHSKVSMRLDSDSRQVYTAHYVFKQSKRSRYFCSPPGLFSHQLLFCKSSKSSSLHQPLRHLDRPLLLLLPQPLGHRQLQAKNPEEPLLQQQRLLHAQL